MKVLLSDGHVECPYEIFQKFRVLPELMVDSSSFPMPYVTVRIFSKMMEFAQTGSIPDAPVDNWCVSDEKFNYLKEIALAADYLNYPELFEEACRLIARCLCDKTGGEIDAILS